MKKVIVIGFTAIFVLLSLVLIISGIGRAVYNRNVEKEIDRFLEKQNVINATVTIDDLEFLPSPVQKWLITSGVLDRERAYNARLKQTADIRMDQNQENWIPLEADQYISVIQPGFLWDAKIKMAPFLHVSGRDLYDSGAGNMLIKFQSLFTIADATGYEIDQGTLVRFLAEIVWVPSAALEDYMTWEPIDDYSARARMEYRGVSATGVFTFDEDGNPIHFIAERYGEFDGEYVLLAWSTVMGGHQFMDGYKVPTTASITWELDSGDYTWFVLNLEDLQFNSKDKY